MHFMTLKLTPNLPAKSIHPYQDALTQNTWDFRGFDSSIILILRDGILISIGDFLDCLSQAILVGIILVGRLGVFGTLSRRPAQSATIPRTTCES